MTERESRKEEKVGKRKREREKKEWNGKRGRDLWGPEAKITVYVFLRSDGKRLGACMPCCLVNRA